ncbi:MAG: hypothetical protein JWM43_4021 [Acidobacteriaceae bacterium]|jgi:hypothetical protein|nr:hypothetical protein [Acidobacteriaceae bacterium]
MSDPTRELNIAPLDIDNLKPLESDPEAIIPKHPHDPDHINPKLASDIRYWADEFKVSGQILHEAVRIHGTSAEKVRAALAAHRVSLT